MTGSVRGFVLAVKKQNLNVITTSGFIYRAALVTKNYMLGINGSA